VFESVSALICDLKPMALIQESFEHLTHFIELSIAVCVMSLAQRGADASAWLTTQFTALPTSSRGYTTMKQTLPCFGARTLTPNDVNGRLAWPRLFRLAGSSQSEAVILFR
jgi:hypothetical protein